MASEGFQMGDLVWAKMKGYPPWPAKIVEPLPDAKPPKSKKSQFVYFFGSNNFAWIMEENITPHSESMLDVKKKSVPYLKAVEELYNFSKSNQESKLTSPKTITAIVKKEKVSVTSVGGDTHMQIVPKKEIKEENENSPSSPMKAIKIAKKSQQKVVRIPKACASRSFAQKRFLDIKVKEEPNECTSPKNRKPMLNKDPYASNVASSSGLNNELVNCSGKHVMPTKKKIGFIGLGHIGKAVVRNFLRSGHDVTVWNRKTYKCEVFVEFGAKKAQSPADLVMACDIIFCSVSDPDASKEIVFGDHGILKGLCEAEKKGNVVKGYVEMTTIDSETSKEIHEIITKKGCKYLEAPIFGDSSKALKGTLMILASGNNELFLECETCFHAIAKHAYFVSSNVGFGSKLSLLLNMFSGIVYTAVAEALVLCKRMKLSEEDFFSILSEGPLQCENIIEKSKRMINSKFSTVTALKHVQKDLSLTLALGNEFSQPMPVTAAAHEVYKHAKCLQYSDLDVSAVYEGVRY